MEKSSLQLKPAAICLALILTGCSTAPVEETTTSSDIPVSFETETSSEPSAAETTEYVDNRQILPHEYNPSGDGYFSLFDEGYGTRIKSQIGGTCWAYAASTAMESNYKVRTGENITIAPISIVESVYGSDKEEGCFLNNGVNRLDAGGWSAQVVFAGANGDIEDLIVINADCFPNDDPDVIKDAIRTHGALCIGINDQDHNYNYVDNYTTLCAHLDEDTDPILFFDHAVVLVGWDDNFPKEYFVNDPQTDGAWLAQNSMGGPGLYWISYETPLEEIYSLEICIGEYDSVAYYDCCTVDTVEVEGGTYIANVFHQPGDLSAIGFYTMDDGQNVTIEVLDGEFGEVLSSIEVCPDRWGYHTVTLPEPVEVTDYTIVARYDGSAAIEGPGYEDDTLYLEVTSQAGQSFIYINGEWHDTTLPETLTLLGREEAVNNCCLKGLYS